MQQFVALPVIKHANLLKSIRLLGEEAKRLGTLTPAQQELIRTNGSYGTIPSMHTFRFYGKQQAYTCLYDLLSRSTGTNFEVAALLLQIRHQLDELSATLTAAPHLARTQRAAGKATPYRVVEQMLELFLA